MSWSVASSGKAIDVQLQIAKQIDSVKLNDEGEMRTVKLVGSLLAQALGTFAPERLVKVTASGSMGWQDYQAKSSAYQNFTISVEPIHLTT